MSEPKRKCVVRQYNVEYLKFGFVPSFADKTRPMCLICQKTFSNEAMKPSRLLDHLSKMHADKKDNPLSFFQSLQTKQTTVTSMFSATPKQDDDGLRASYNISLMIAKSGQPHTIGEELILPAVKEVISTMLHKPVYDITKKLPLSNSTVQRRIDEMAENIEGSLCEHLRTSQFAMQLDESTLPGNESLLLSYVRFVKDGKSHEEFLFAKLLKTDTKGETIFQTLENFLTEKEIPWSNILAIATDGAPAMVGRYKGLIAHVKKNIPGVLAIHCVIHRQHLVAKNLSERLHKSLQLVITTVNKIRSSALSDRLFRQLCTENDEEFNRLLLHTEVRWLSRGACLERFNNLLTSVLEFLEDKDPVLREKLINSACDIAYMTDLFNKFNEINLKLQGDDLNLIKTKGIVSSFSSKLLLWKRNLGRGDLSQFPCLSKKQIVDQDRLEYCAHLETLHSDICTRFEDILSLDIPAWILNPFTNMPENVDPAIEEELIELTSNEELKFMFDQGYQKFWLQKEIPHLYPGLWQVVRKMFLAFPSSYLVERGFSAITNLITKKRNKLDIESRGDLRLFLTKMAPDIQQLAASHQVHPSH